MLVTAHRGASAAFPENTLLAFKESLSMGATGIELDVRQCKTGEMMVIHDKTTDRTTGAQGEVAQLSLAELKALDAGEGEAIPTLAEVFAAVAGKAGIFVEMKDDASEAVAKTIHEAVKLHGFSYATLPVISFDHAMLVRLKLKHPHIQIGFSYAQLPAGGISHMIAEAKTLGASGINPNHAMVTPELVSAAHAEGLTVNVWTVNHPAAMRRMIDARVDAIMTDYPDKLVQQLAP